MVLKNRGETACEKQGASIIQMSVVWESNYRRLHFFLGAGKGNGAESSPRKWGCPGQEIRLLGQAGVFPVSSEREEQLPTALPRSPLPPHLSVGLDPVVAACQGGCLSAASAACGAVGSDSLTKDLLWEPPWAGTRQEGTEEPQLPNCACPRVFCWYSHPEGPDWQHPPSPEPEGSLERLPTI